MKYHYDLIFINLSDLDENYKQIEKMICNIELKNDINTLFKILNFYEWFKKIQIYC